MIGLDYRIKLTDSNYSDSVLSTLSLDQVYLGCNQLTGLTWQEVKGSSEIHISSAGDEPYYEESLCGTNTINGYEALKKITDIIYINIQNNSIKNLFKNKDVFLFNNFNQI